MMPATAATGVYLRMSACTRFRARSVNAHGVTANPNLENHEDVVA